MPTSLVPAIYTLKEIWLYTYSQHNNRFDYKDRDVLKRVDINEIKVYGRDRHDMPSHKYKIHTFSYPQYEPYLGVKGKNSKSQRKIRHEYEQVFQFEYLGWNSHFKWRVGSQKKWPDDSKINYKQIKQVHSSIKQKYEKKYGKGSIKYKEAIIKHKKKAKFISKGDYISQTYGINGDFRFRVEGNAFLSGNLFGLAWNKERTGDGMPFFGKHDIRVVEYLLKKGIIRRD